MAEFQPLLGRFHPQLYGVLDRLPVELCRGGISSPFDFRRKRRGGGPVPLGGKLQLHRGVEHRPPVLENGSPSRQMLRLCLFRGPPSPGPVQHLRRHRLVALVSWFGAALATGASHGRSVICLPGGGGVSTVGVHAIFSRKRSVSTASYSSACRSSSSTSSLRETFSSARTPSQPRNPLHLSGASSRARTRSAPPSSPKKISATRASSICVVFRGGQQLAEGLRRFACSSSGTGCGSRSPASGTPS